MHLFLYRLLDDENAMYSTSYSMSYKVRLLHQTTGIKISPLIESVSKPQNSRSDGQTDYESTLILSLRSIVNDRSCFMCKSTK